MSGVELITNTQKYDIDHILSFGSGVDLY